jgi:YVTN family beta-propeller protein
VTNSASDTVSVIDTATDTVVKTIAVGDDPAVVAITPDGTKAYVTNYQAMTVSVIDIATNTVIETVDVGERSIGVAVKPDGQEVYVIGTDDGTPFTPAGTNNVIVIDTATDTVLRRFPSGGDSSLPDPADSWLVAITPDGSKAYVTNRRSQTVSVIDTATESVLELIDIVGVPVSLAITPDGAKVYVGNDRGTQPSENGPGIVWVIDTAIDTVSKTITSTALGDDFDLAKRVPGVAITPDGAQAWVTLHEAGKIGAISVTTDQLTTTLGPIDPLLPCVDGNRPGCANGIAITPDGSKAYVTMGGSSNKVAVFNLTTNMLLGTITVGNNPSQVAITPDRDGDGFSGADGDCDDNNPDIHPGAQEVCNGIDDDCDGTVDDNPTGVGQGCSTGLLGVCDTGATVCSGGALSCAQAVFPSAETCDGLDNDCDGVADDNSVVASAGGLYPVDEGDSVTVTASVSSPVLCGLMFAWDLDNNGSFETPGQSVTFSAVELDGPSSHTIKVQVTDGPNSAIAQATVDVLNVAPTVGNITAPIAPVQVNTLINTSANFTDPGEPDTHTAVWDWDDGSTSAGTVNSAG